MKLHNHLSVGLLALCRLTALADETTVSVSSAYAYTLDTTGLPRTAATELEIAALPPVAWLAGETVTVTNPTGTKTVIVSNAPGCGTYAWHPSAGGVYSFVNDREGNAVVNVYYSAFGFNGSGTVRAPSHVVDSGDFAATLALASSLNGFTFALDGSGTTLDGFAIPSGYAAVAFGNGIWQLIAADDGLVAASPAAIYFLDSEREGPNRKGRKNRPWPEIAYTGDGWARDATAASTLTLTPPGEAASAAAHVGSGTVPFAPRRTGLWTVALTYGSTTLTGEIEVIPEATVMILR